MQTFSCRAQCSSHGTGKLIRNESYRYAFVFQTIKCVYLKLNSSLYLQAGADAKFNDYKPKVAFFFPGQGAQTVGMCKDVAAEVPAAKELFDRASEILGYDLLNMCVEGKLQPFSLAP